MSFVKHAKHAINDKLIKNGEANVAIELLQKIFLLVSGFLNQIPMHQKEATLNSNTFYQKTCQQQTNFLKDVAMCKLEEALN